MYSTLNGIGHDKQESSQDFEDRHIDRRNHRVRKRIGPVARRLWHRHDGRLTVAFMDPEAVLKLVDRAEVTAIGTDVRALLQRVCASLTT